MSTYRFRGLSIPDYMMDGLTRWIEDAVWPGHFLTAVLQNDLSEAVNHADGENLKNLAAYVGYLYNVAPSACWGSEKKMRAWKGTEPRNKVLNP